MNPFFPCPHRASRHLVGGLCSLMMCMLAIPTQAGVSVVFANPDGYADMPLTESGKADVLKALEGHFAQFAKRLPSGKELKIEVLDIDLAGRLERSIRYSVDMRVLRGGADWPSINLRYSLEESGKVVRNGEARLIDMNYLNHHNRYAASDPVRYEKVMIDNWFRSTILDSQ